MTSPLGKLKAPLDAFPYPIDPRSRPAAGGLPDGLFAYVRDERGTVYVVPDGPHVHPKVLGQARLALYAGDLTISGGEATDVTNLSGTFQFDDPSGLIDVANPLEFQGLPVRACAVRFFPLDGSQPRVLR